MAATRIRYVANRFGAWLVLLAAMAVTFVVTAFAVANTSEAIYQVDTDFSDVMRKVDLSTDPSAARAFVASLQNHFETGSFGVPKKLKLPESKTTLDIVNALYTDGSFRARKGVAHQFISYWPLQKVFGQSVIYLRINTPTTRNLGNTLPGDIINIVTTDGWQLGYAVKRVTDSLIVADMTPGANSRLLVITIDEQTGVHNYYFAELEKVGERI